MIMQCMRHVALPCRKVVPKPKSGLLRCFVGQAIESARVTQLRPPAFDR